MQNTSSFLMNHGFVFDHCEGLALACWYKDAMPPFVVPEDYKVLRETFANLLGRNPSHVFWDIFNVL
jgi:hypothetical protein